MYCGSSRRVRAVYTRAAKSMGEALVRRGLGLVYGGSRTGSMGVIADTVIEQGGDVTGVIPNGFSAETAHQGLTDLRVVETMHQRKALMAELADAFIAMPGAYGTMDEFCEILAWSQLRIHEKPCGLLNVGGYFDSFLAFLDRAVSEDFLKPVHRGLILEEDDPERLLNRLGV